jgi:hypothetical protein
MTTVISREMGITHSEFFRLFPLAAEGYDYAIEGDTVIVNRGHRNLTIRLSAEGERRIALLAVPVTHVEFEFNGFTEGEIGEFMGRFDRAYQRGGG